MPGKDRNTAPAATAAAAAAAATTSAATAATATAAISERDIELTAATAAASAATATAAISDDFDEFYEKFSPTPTKLKEATQQFKLAKKHLEMEDYNRFRQEALRDGKTPIAVEVFYAEIGGERRPMMITYHDAYHIKEVLKGPKGLIGYLNVALHTLIHDNFVAAEFLSGTDKQKICSTTMPESFDKTVFVSQLIKPCNIVFFGAASVKSIDYSTTDIIKQCFETKDLIVRKLPDLVSPDASSNEDGLKKRKHTNRPKDGRFKVFYKEYTAVTEEELGFLKNIKSLLDERWYQKFADSDNEEETSK